ncbi:MAG: hypothetical protein HY208_09470 [Nitrospirae bacterium]|nr:hypothetical protein [Nitrospirota bacterium]
MTSTLGACAGGRPAVSPEFGGGPLLLPVHHQLHVTLDPPARSLTGEDLITLKGPTTASPTAFYLNEHFIVDAVFMTTGAKQQAVPFHREKPRLPRASFARQRYAAFERMVRYEIDLPAEPAQPLQLTILYQGRWPAAAAPETTDTAQPLTERGAQLTADEGWYPLWPDALFTIDLTIDHPAGWEAVGAGRRGVHTGRSTGWSMTQPTETIDLIAGSYAVTTRQTDGIELSTYLFTEEASLAPVYLDAAADYLARYSRLLGPYPFSKLAVVETAAPIGAAVPSLVLLGRPLIKRHYTQPYGLGHEIVHAWFGNSVMPDESQGNWTEALTTYVANYYTVEEENGDAAARQQRSRMLRQYAVQAPPEQDYPLMRFLHNDSQTDAAIGYQKGAFVFHLLRRMMGDEDFFAALRDLTRRYGGKRAGWNDLRLIFEARSGRPLDWFFLQWIVQAGAPQVAIEQVTMTPLPPEPHDSTAPTEPDGPPGLTIAVTLRQQPPIFRLPITVQIDTHDRMLEKSIWMDQERMVIETTTAAPPLRVVVDPETQVFRRLERDELPPMLNLTLTEPSFAIVPPDLAGPELTRAYQAIADGARMRHEAQAAPSGSLAGDHAAARLVLGGPSDNRATAELAQRLPEGVEITPGGFTVGGHSYDGAGHALLLSFRDPAGNHCPVTLFYGLSPDAVVPLAPLLFYHGWDSYVVFENGRAIATGELPSAHSPLLWTPP